MLNYFIIPLAFLLSVTFSAVYASVRCSYVQYVHLPAELGDFGDIVISVFSSLRIFQHVRLSGRTDVPQLSVQAAFERSVLACLEIHCVCLNTIVEAARTRFSLYACGKSESECQVVCRLLKR